MILRNSFFIISCCCSLSILSASVEIVPLTAEQLALEEDRARQVINDLEPEILRRKNKAAEAEWGYDSNLTDENLRRKNEVSTENAKFDRQIAESLLEFNFKAFSDKNLSRIFEKSTDLGYSVLPEEKYTQLMDAITAMSSNYAKVKICSYKDRTKCDLQLEPEITEVLSNSRDPEELKYYWVEWYNKAGTPTRESFQTYVDLAQESAILNNYTSLAEYWLKYYEDPTFEQQLNDIFEQFQPFYEQIHGYVRHKLHEYYGDVVPVDKPIPMHLLGNMWGQTWDEISDIIRPFPNKKSLDVTEEMVKQGYTPLKMFQMGDEFFQSLNMTKLPDTFWEKSIIEKPNDGRDLICHASAWDFFKTDDMRIKQCSRINMDNFFVVHHELGHIQYYLQYQHLPNVYREGANPGFHEAVGDVLSLSVSTPKHLKKVGLLKEYVEDEEAKINQYFRSGLGKLVFIPFAYTIDKYRWDIFRGNIKPSEYNCRFWKLREQYSGIEPPVVRTEQDFDPPAKYHVAADVEYLRYLVSYIVQFQFHKAACIKAGQYEPGNPDKALIDCDIYQSPEAGNALKAMLSLGSSKPWHDAMEVMTGQRKMDAGPLLEYFDPLYKWLIKTNKEIGAHIGWTKSDKCVSSDGLLKNPISLVNHVGRVVS